MPPPNFFVRSAGIDEGSAAIRFLKSIRLRASPFLCALHRKGENCIPNAKRGIIDEMKGSCTHEQTAVCQTGRSARKDRSKAANPERWGAGVETHFQEIS